MKLSLATHFQTAGADEFALAACELFFCYSDARGIHIVDTVSGDGIYENPAYKRAKIVFSADSKYLLISCRKRTIVLRMSDFSLSREEQIDALHLCACDRIFGIVDRKGTLSLYPAAHGIAGRLKEVQGVVEIVFSSGRHIIIKTGSEHLGILKMVGAYISYSSGRMQRQEHEGLVCFADRKSVFAAVPRDLDPESEKMSSGRYWLVSARNAGKKQDIAVAKIRKGKPGRFSVLYRTINAVRTGAGRHMVWFASRRHVFLYVEKEKYRGFGITGFRNILENIPKVHEDSEDIEKKGILQIPRPYKKHALRHALPLPCIVLMHTCESRQLQ